MNWLGSSGAPLCSINTKIFSYITTSGPVLTCLYAKDLMSLQNKLIIF